MQDAWKGLEPEFPKLRPKELSGQGPLSERINPVQWKRVV